MLDGIAANQCARDRRKDNVQNLYGTVRWDCPSFRGRSTNNDNVEWPKCIFGIGSLSIIYMFAIAGEELLPESPREHKLFRAAATWLDGYHTLGNCWSTDSAVAGHLQLVKDCATTFRLESPNGIVVWQCASISSGFAGLSSSRSP